MREKNSEKKTKRSEDSSGIENPVSEETHDVAFQEENATEITESKHIDVEDVGNVTDENVEKESALEADTTQVSMEDEVKAIETENEPEPETVIETENEPEPEPETEPELEPVVEPVIQTEIEIEPEPDPEPDPEPELQSDTELEPSIEPDSSSETPQETDLDSEQVVEADTEQPDSTLQDNETESADTPESELESDITTETLSETETNVQEPVFDLEMIDKSMISIVPGRIVSARVINVAEKEIMVDIGSKSEASIAISEFSSDDIPSKGDTIEVFVVSRDSAEGRVILSKKRADAVTNFKKIREAYKKNLVITGIVTRRNRGGMVVDIQGVEAFLPSTHMSIKHIPNLDQFINKEVSIKVVKLDESKKTVVVSRKIVLEEEFEKKKEQLKETIKINTELDGEVKNITDYGAFVDLGGMDGLLHITDMSWGKLSHPSEMLNIGDKIKVKCLGFDEKNNRVALGIKQLVPHPWENIEAKFLEGSKVSGKVVSLTKYGAFVELEPGVEGLIHISEMSWTKTVLNPKKFVKKGEIVNVIVLEVLKDQQRISLGLKQMQANPWIAIEEHYPVGTIITRKITSIAHFGVFIEIEDGIEGLVHKSDISWTKRVVHPGDFYKKGDEITAVVLYIDKMESRISLGLKQLTEDPWEDIIDNLRVNTEVVGIVSKCIPKGILVDIPFKEYFIEGFVPISHLAIPQIDKTEEAFDIDEKIDMKIIEVDTESRRLVLSVKAWFFSRDKQELKDYQTAHLERAEIKKEKGTTQENKPVKRRRRRGRGGGGKLEPPA